ncbi:hypothetical protein QQ054_14950 [Oscillatoria amoena NRMC-F 0135]|nr:hypothetical protein [Oscillatoria amoena NRMC-F 0135]
MWRSRQKLVDLNGRDFLTVHDSFQNFIAFGDTGAGKTSGPLQTVTNSFIRTGFGGVLLCVKIGAAADYIRWATDAGREQDIIHFGIAKGQSFNFLDFASNRAGDKTLVVEDLVHVLTDTMEIIDRHKAADDPFFKPASHSVLRSAITALFIVRGRIELHELAKFLSTLPRDGNDLQAGTSYCARMLREAWEKARGGPEEEQVRQIITFFGVDWANYAVDTRESIRATAQVVINELTHEPLLSLFGKSTTVSPADVLDGKLVVVDIPILLRERTGKVANTIWRTSIQRAILARPIPSHKEADSVRPVFILGDEAQYLVTSGDQLFVSSSREHRGITFFATQTINSLIDAIGKPATMSLLGGLRNVFVNRTNDADTANWFRDSMNQVVNYGLNDGPVTWVVHDFSTEMLRSLKQGGPDGKVEALFRKANDKFKVNGLRWCRVSFRQRDVVPKNFLMRMVRLLTSNDARVLQGGK